IAGKSLTIPSELPEVFRTRAAVFVTIAKNGRRRGCKGVFEPATDNLAAEIVRAAIGAATADIRYRPIRANELNQITFTVSIVGPLKRVSDPYNCSPADQGLLIRASGKSGVILPGEAKTSSWGLAEAKRQAGIKPGEPYELYMFKTLALHETTGAPDKRRR
ncbi:MAG: AMMECR1 domain-containing protein, partial [Armatimonadetes bacterium]|nr:AMMECR1 domain-containing protein [Armatimonadota bacterium]